MNKGLTLTVAMVVLIAAQALANAQERQIYKVVDEDGNVIFTDTPPSEDAEPMDLPELSVIQTNYPKAEEAAPGDGEAGEEAPLTMRDLRRMYRDFAIQSPANEETFWGTENSVSIRWGSQTPFEPGLSVRLLVDGERRDVAPQGSVTLSLARGEHTAQAILRDAKGRTIKASSPVTFFVKQQSVNFRRPSISIG